jgi:hypothetical protein
MDLRSKITPPTPKVKAILAELNNLPKEAEERAKTLEELKKENRELKKQLGQRPIPTVDNKQLELAEKKGYTQARQEIVKLQSSNSKFQSILKKISQIASLSPEFIVEKPAKMLPPGPAPVHPIQIPRVKIETVRHPTETIDNDNDNVILDKCGRSILSLLYNNPQRAFKRALIGVFTGYSHKSGGFNNAICKLNATGLIKRNGGNIILSEEGSASGAELLGEDVNLYETFTVQNWERNLPKCEGKIFRFLMDNPGTEFAKEEIGEQTGYSSDSGGFNNAVCRLNALALIIRQGGRIKLNEEILEL